MIDLDNCTISAIADFGEGLLRTYRDTLHSFEQAASETVRSIYSEFQRSGEKTFALVRIYRLFRYNALSPDLKAIADPGVDYWMALMGTVGNEAAWCDRHTSKGHKVIKAVGERSPMVTAAFEQIGLEFSLKPLVDKPDSKGDPLKLEEGASYTSYFHVPKALGSPLIPAQKDFVEPYHIESVVGIGSPFVSQAMYLAVCFSKVPINRDGAQKFSELSSHVSTLLALYDEGAIWAQ